MNKNLLIKDTFLELSCSERQERPYHLDFGWKLAIHEIKVIGLWTKLVGDDDTNIIINISHWGEIFPITLNSLQDVSEVWQFYMTVFNIDIYENKYDATVVYPPNLQGTNVFSDSIWIKIKRQFELIHPGMGNLSSNVKKHLEERKFDS